MGTALKDKGWLEFKRGLAAAYDYIPHQLLRHFTRGLIDGDGSVSIRPHNPNRKLTPFMTYCDMYYEIVAKFLDVICSHCAIKRNKIYERPGGKLSSIHYSGTDAAKIINWAYDKCTIALSRKWHSALEIIKLPQLPKYGETPRPSE